ncbi:MAG: universal stress protein [Roseiarcus sp.]
MVASVAALIGSGPLSTNGEYSTLLHPTDFAADGALAFAHAVRLAGRAQQMLSLLNFASADGGPRPNGLRQVAGLLERWGEAPPETNPEDLEMLTGLRVVSAVIPGGDARSGIIDYMANHRCDLAVIAMRDHHGLSRWMERSVAARVLRRAMTMVLILRAGARGFVDPATGAFNLSNVLVPVGGKHDPTPALARLAAWLEALGASAEVRLLHVGPTPPVIAPTPGVPAYTMITREGAVAPAILEHARRWPASLIVAPTSPTSGLISALRSSVTSALLDDARFPVLSIPTT